MALPCVRMGAVRLRSGDVYRFLCRSSSQAAAATQEIEIPKKKTWDKTAVLQALAYTVSHDPTSSSYQFQDDPYLAPKSSADYKVYPMSKESGRNAAKFVLNMYPNLFEKDIAEPHIPCLMPESVQPMLEEVSEEALKERIKLRRLKDSVNLYDQLLQAGTQPSLETTNRLLDLLCFYGDKEPTEEKEESDDQENENAKGQKGPRSLNKPVNNWRDNNNAERIFNLMPEKDAHSYRTMIRGMVKHNAYSKAFDMYTDLLNNRLTGDVHTFTALIKAAPRVKSERRDKWALIVDLLNQMVQQKVQPNLYTFNAVLKSLSSGPREMAQQTLNEMRALRIEPSLATFHHLLMAYFKLDDASMQATILDEILEMIQGKSFTVQDPDDVKFFAEAMKVCFEAKDLELAYKLDALRNTGDNWKLLGNRGYTYMYYGRFFSVICLLEDIDTVFKWYREHIPSRYYPISQGIEDLLQLVEIENRLELIPEIWRDVFLTGHTNKDSLMRKFLGIMTRGNPSPELQQEFANIAISMRDLYDAAVYSSSRLKWSAAILGDILILLCRAGKTEDVRKLLKHFKVHNLVPGSHVIDELMSCVKASGNASMAIDLVQLAARYSLPNTANLAETALKEFTLTEEQRIILQDLNSGSSSDSSESDQE